MAMWLEVFPEPSGDHHCSKHKDRPAVAVKMRELRGGKPPAPYRYYCHECLTKEMPGIADHGPDS